MNETDKVDTKNVEEEGIPESLRRVVGPTEDQEPEAEEQEKDDSESEPGA